MKKILVVDDAAFMRQVLKTHFNKSGFHVVEAANGLEAIDMYKQEKPDIVTLDVTMPELDGIGALREIMKFDEQAKVCMITAMGQQSLILESVKLGAKDFIVKPFDADDLIEKIKRL